MSSWRALGYRVADRVRRVWWVVRRPTTFGVKCVIEHEGRWLMVRTTYGHRRWTFPGGGVGRREPTEAAVRREVLEEVGIVLGAIERIGAYRGPTKPNDTVTLFRANVDSDQFAIHRGEIAEAAWFDRRALPELRSAAAEVAIALVAGC